MKLPGAFLAGSIAHRGLHGPGCPENSMAAFEAAASRGIAIELDVQLSGDGVAMVFHDATLDRLTDATGPVDAMPAEALAALPLHGGGTIPRLSEVLRQVNARVPLLIEVKDRTGDMGPDIGPLEAAALDSLDGYGGDVALMSFNPHSIARFRRDAPHLPRGLVTARFDAEHWPDLAPETRARLAGIPDYDRVGACFVNHQADALDMPRIAELRRRGAAILCWTIRSPEEAREALRIADAVTFEGYLP